MDEELKQAVMDHYFSEYYQSTLAEKSGLMGKLMRFNNKIEKKITTTGVDLNNVLILAVMIPATTILPFEGVMIAAGSVGSYMATLLGGSVSIRNAAYAAMEKDIENGRLMSRYKEEVLAKNIFETQAQVQKISEMELKSSFKKSSQDKKNNPPTNSIRLEIPKPE